MYIRIFRFFSLGPKLRPSLGDLYNPAYGNGIGESKSLSNPGSIYTPLATGFGFRI